MSQSHSNLPRAVAVATKTVLEHIVLVATSLALGCTTLPPTSPSQTITSEMLLLARPIVGERTLTPLPDANVLELDSEMLAFLDRFVDTKQSDYSKLHQLLRAIMGDGSFGLEYSTQTHTTVETFHTQRGNCLSFTNMFVAMARRVGIDARFQEVGIPPDWTVQGDSFILNRHVNVLVKLRSVGERVVDFNIDDFQANYDRRPIDDMRALAHYYNNLGAERMLAEETVEALLYFRKAIDEDPNFSPPWTNLGTLYRRNEDLAYSEAAFVHALDINPRDLAAMSNLSTLYEDQGDTQRAAAYWRRVNNHRMRNPYYRYQLGREAFLSADYEGAIGHLKQAVRLEQSEHSFYSLLGLSYLKMGDTDTAKRWLVRAKEVSTTDSLKQDYDSKIEKLLSTPSSQ